MGFESIFFGPLKVTLFQLAALAVFCLAIGWLAAVSYHYDKVDEVLCQLHATDDSPRPPPRSLGPLLDALTALFTDYRHLLWRLAAMKGEKPRPLHDASHSPAYVRAYNLLRAYGRTPSTTEVNAGQAHIRRAAQERRRAS